MKPERSRFRSKLILLLCGACLALVASEVFPVLSLGFWRVAYASEFAPSYVDPRVTSSPPVTLMCLRIRAAPTAVLSYKLMYRIGNAQGQAYALLGLKDIDWAEYERLRDDYALKSGEVAVDSGCLVTREHFQSAIMWIELADYAAIDREKHFNELEAHFAALRTASSAKPAAP